MGCICTNMSCPCFWSYWGLQCYNNKYVFFCIICYSDGLHCNSSVSKYCLTYLAQRGKIWTIGSLCIIVSVCKALVNGVKSSLMATCIMAPSCGQMKEVQMWWCLHLKTHLDVSSVYITVEQCSGYGHNITQSTNVSICITFKYSFGCTTDSCTSSLRSERPNKCFITGRPIVNLKASGDWKRVMA